MPPERVTPQSSLEERQSHTVARLKSSLLTFKTTIKSTTLAQSQFKGLPNRGNIVGLTNEQVEEAIEADEELSSDESKQLTALLEYTQEQLIKIEKGKSNDFQE